MKTYQNPQPQAVERNKKQPAKNHQEKTTPSDKKKIDKVATD